MSFRFDDSTGVFLWTGAPDSQAGHNWLLEWLRAHAQPFLPPPPEELSFSRQGNLAEAITMCVGAAFRRPTPWCIPKNAQRPWRDISQPDIDLLWLGFGENEIDDFVVVQEVKSTGKTNLAYADNLLKDYAKLFSDDAQVTLRTRLQGLQTELEMAGVADELVHRLSRLAGNSPATCGRSVKLIPTLVHDLASEHPSTRMLAIQATLTAEGWADVESWAIGLDDLLARFARLSRGLP